MIPAKPLADTGRGPVGIVMLVHTALDRAEQVARHWYAAGCPVVIHCDKSTPRSDYRAFRKALSGPAGYPVCHAAPL